MFLNNFDFLYIFSFKLIILYVFECFDILILKINLKKNIILIYFLTKKHFKKQFITLLNSHLMQCCDVSCEVV